MSKRIKVTYQGERVSKISKEELIEANKEVLLVMKEVVKTHEKRAYKSNRDASELVLNA